jgi:hypothetical protein
MERFPDSAATFPEARRYLYNRAVQLLAAGARFTSFEDMGDHALAHIEYQGCKFLSVYLLEGARGKNRYLEIVKNAGPILTVPDCRLENYLKRHGVDHIVVEPHPNCRAEYAAIESYYGDRRAERTKAFYMDHIDEGLKVLSDIGAPPIAEKVFCLHPLFQGDSDFLATAGTPEVLEGLDPLAIAGAVEYRHVANNYLAHHASRTPELSPYTPVNLALIADKVQNRKDFEQYHLGTHPRSARLAEYFSEWLETLGISEDRYQDLKSGLCKLHLPR